MKALVLAVLVTAAFIPARAAAAAGRVQEPASTPVKIVYDAQGRPQQFTIKVGGFKPGDLVSVEQCDGKPVTDPSWGVTLDCDTATVPAQANADARGVVTFPANDINFGFQPVRGTSPQHFFNCLGPGDHDPKNRLPSFTTCQVRVATSYLARTGDEVFFPIDFGGSTASAKSSSSSSGISTLAIVGIVALVALVILVVVLLIRRRSRQPA